MHCLSFKNDLWDEGRSLAIWSLAGITLGGGVYFLTHSIGSLVVVSLAFIATWLSMISERRFRREYAARAPLSDDQFVAAFYSDSDVQYDIPRRLRPIYCEFFQLDPAKLHPHDRPPELIDLDTFELQEAIEKEFGISFADSDLEQINGSFDSIARYLARRRASQ